MSNPMLDRLNALLISGEKIRSFRFPEREGVLFQLGESNRAKLLDWKDNCLELVGSSMGMDSEVFRAFPIDLPDLAQGAFHTAMDHYLSILRVFKEMMEEGANVVYEVRVPPQFIVEGARQLLEAGYKDAAAIYCRAAFETSLRSLCKTNGIELEGGASINKMAQRLMEATFLHFDELKAIEMWANYANAAAHGQFDQYKEEQVNRMVFWLEEFVSKAI
jgi:HEPN domain-containing protein